jgi:hypothetical protein
VVGIHHVDGYGVSLDGLAAGKRKLSEVDGPLRVKVVEPMPQLHVDSVLLNGNHLQILEGVSSQATVSFENTGKRAVDWIRIAVAENLSVKPSLHSEQQGSFSLVIILCFSYIIDSGVFSWKSKEPELSVLSHPLGPGQVATAVMDVYGLAGTIGATFTVQYGSNEDCFRKEIHHIPIFVIKGLEIRSFDVQMCSFQSEELPSAFRLRDETHLRNRPLSLLLFQVANCAKTTFSVQASLQFDADAEYVSLCEDLIVSPNATRLFALPIPRFWIADADLEDVPKPTGQFIRVRPEDELTPEQAHAQVSSFFPFPCLFC